MSWIQIKLEKGDYYPGHVSWPDGIEASIPVSSDIFKTASPPDEMPVQLFGKEMKSGIVQPLVWVDSNGGYETAFDIQEWIESLKSESYRPEHKKPLTARIPFHYHIVKEPIRNQINKVLIKVRSSIGLERRIFPLSHFDPGCEILLGVCDRRWDVGIHLPILVLTHDIDTESGFKWVESIINVEEKYGFRSSWNVVPRRYRIDNKILYKILNRGHEVGLHGLWHNTKEAFLTKEQMIDEFTELKSFMKSFSIKGYRSPSWFRTKTMFQVLSKFFSYDLSCLDTDLICPAGKGGVGFMRPFRLGHGLLELPCTLPFEAPLFWGIAPESLLEHWRKKIEFIESSRGLLLINTHPDSHYMGNMNLLAQYDKLLCSLASQNWRCQLPRELACDIRDDANNER